MSWLVSVLLAAGSVEVGAIDWIEGRAMQAVFDENYKTGEALLRVAVAYHQSRSGAAMDCAEALNCLGIALLFQERLDEAEQCFREATGHFRGMWGNGEAPTPNAVGNLSRVLVRLGRYREAEDLLARDLANTIKFAPKEPQATSGTLVVLASLYARAERWEDAERCGRRALDFFYDGKGFVDLQVRLACGTLTDVYIRLGRIRDAEYVLGIGLRDEIGKNALVFELADFRLAFGSPRDAIAGIDARLAELKKEGIPLSQLYLAKVNLRKGEALARMGDRAGGKKLLLEAVSLFEKEGGPTDPLVVRSLETGAKLYPEDPDQFATRLNKVRELRRAQVPRGVAIAIGKLPGGDAMDRKAEERQRHVESGRRGTHSSVPAIPLATP